MDGEDGEMLIGSSLSISCVPCWKFNSCEEKHAVPNVYQNKLHQTQTLTDIPNSIVTFPQHNGQLTKKSKYMKGY